MPWSDLGAVARQYTITANLDRGDFGSRSDSRELMHPDTRTCSLGDVTEMQMVREVDHLPCIGHFGKEPERLLCAKVVERLHDIVGDEGY